MVAPRRRDPADMKLAMEHSWAWFSLHATQRLQAVNFFLVATAFLCAAFVTAIKEKLYPVAVSIALLGLLVSYYLYRMERRIRSLIQAAEHALEPLQQELACVLKDDALQIVRHVEEAKPGEWKYSKVFRLLYTVTGLLFALGLCYSAYKFSEEAFPKTVWDGAGYSMSDVVMKLLLGAGVVLAGYVIIVKIPPPPETGKDCLQNIVRWLLFTFGSVFLIAGTVAVLRGLFD